MARNAKPYRSPVHGKEWNGTGWEPEKKRPWRHINPESALRGYAKVIKQFHAEINERNQRICSLQGEVLGLAGQYVGDRLLLAKQLLIRMKKDGKTYNGGPVPGFMTWVEENTDVSHSTANDYMWVSRNWNKIQHLVGDPEYGSIRGARRYMEEEKERKRKEQGGEEKPRDKRKWAVSELRAIFNGWIDRLSDEAALDIALDDDESFWQALEDVRRGAEDDARHVRHAVRDELNRSRRPSRTDASEP